MFDFLLAFVPPFKTLMLREYIRQNDKISTRLTLELIKGPSFVCINEQTFQWVNHSFSANAHDE